jgi:nitroimidazol reductase NimA-like FMN-containing flavoprotein (pyridoxamine 5'-phosphate oxidase superfamily)
MKLAILLITAALTTSCATTGRLTFSGDLAPYGLPVQFAYDGGKNPIHSSK